MSAWIALEVLSPPQTFRRPANLVDGGAGNIHMLESIPDLPWMVGEKARPNTRLFYQIVIGAIDMAEATAELLAVYGDTNIERVEAVGFSPIAILTIDRDGIPVLPAAVAISSFAWGLDFALRKQLASLGDWPAIEPKLNREADAAIRQTGEQGQVLPIDREAIKTLFMHLVQTLSLPAHCLSEPSFAIRIYQYWKAEEPPDPPPMGSFFIGDLAKAKAHFLTGTQSLVLSRFLGLEAPAKLSRSASGRSRAR